MKTNNKKGNKLLSVFLVYLLLLLYILVLSKVNHAIYYIENNSSNLNYTSHAPIIIENDADFIAYGFPGNGSVINPYRIENLQISAAYEGISVMTTSVYFIIQNCLIEDSITGIYIASIAPNTIQILENTIKDNEQGIYLYNSDYAIIANNTMTNNEWSGILIEYSAFAVIANNILTNGGIDFWYDYELSDIATIQVYNNTLDGKPIVWYTSETSLTLSSSIYAQIFLIDCSNITVKDQIISPSKGICLFYCNDVLVENNNCGIEITGSDNVNITNNKLDDRDITVFESTNIIVENNKYDNGDFGIYIYEFSNNVIIRNNICKGRLIGIYIDLSSYCLVENNTCKNNREYGMYLPMADHITIRNNIIENSIIHGIYFVETSYCEIYQNVVDNSLQHGINLAGWGDTSDYNKIYRNIFIDNNKGGTQAVDDGVGNIWYNTSTEKGNYWNDWSGTGEYQISGSAENSDPYPLVDSDDDGMSPEWEFEYDLDLWNDDSAEDLDDDDLTNIEEFNYDTNPRINDTDSDGLNDGEEVKDYQTDPTNEDTDGDGYLDGEEVENGYDPLDPNDYPKEAAYGFFVIVIAIGVVSVLMKKKK